MYNSSRLKSELLGLIGWKQNEDSSGWQLLEMTSSESGSYYNTVHPMLTFDNLQSISKRYDDLTNVEATRNAFFTAWLKGKTEEGIVEAVDMWLENKFQNRSARNLLEDDILFKATGKIEDYDLAGSDIVGMEFLVGGGKSTTMNLREIGLQFENNQSITIYLFKSGEKNPIDSKIVNYTGDGSIQWESLTDWNLNWDAAYWVGYDQSAITGRSVNGVKNYGFSRGGTIDFPTGRYFEARAFNGGAYGGEWWDISNNNYTVDTNYGLNFKLNVRCDYTDFIIDQKSIFKRLIMLQVGIKLLEEMVWNPQSNINRNSSNMGKEDLMYAIEGDTQKTKTGRDVSLTGKREMALMGIAFDESGLDSVCLPCRKKGISIGAIGPVGFRG